MDYLLDRLAWWELIDMDNLEIEDDKSEYESYEITDNLPF